MQNISLAAGNPAYQFEKAEPLVPFRFDQVVFPVHSEYFPGIDDPSFSLNADDGDRRLKTVFADYFAGGPALIWQ